MSATNWSEVVVKDVCESVIDCVNKTAPVVDYETPYKMIRTTNVKNGVVNIESVRYVEKDVFKKWTRRAVPKVGDVILTREAPLGDVGMLTKPGEKIFLGQRLMQYRTDPEKLDNYFLLYALQEGYMQGQLKAAGSGSTVEHVRVGDAENLKIKLPDVHTQKELSSILKAYDNLIENNKRRIAILEEMAQSLYQEWFVKFRFPGHQNTKLGESPLGLIPKGWEVKLVSEVIKRKTAGARYKQDNVESEGDVIVIDQSRDELLGYHNNKPDHEASPENPVAIFGDHTCKMQLVVQPFSVGPNVVPFLPKINYPMPYIFYLVRSLVETKEYKRHWTELNAKDVLLGDMLLAENFSALVKPMLSQINVLKDSNIKIKKQRDLLLPKLISGSITL